MALTRQQLLPGLLASLCLVATGCPEEPPSTEKDAGSSMTDMSADMVVDGDMALPDPSCTSTEECTGPYEGFFCIADVCTECDKGDEGCVCRANGTCQSGLQCGDDALCIPCEDGALDCPCNEDGTCSDGLACEAEVCVPSDCSPGAVDCPCDDGACAGDEPAYCDEMEVCRFCSSDVEGCPCEADDTCLGDNYCTDDDVCETCPDVDKKIDCVCESDAECELGLTCDDDTNRCREKTTCATACMPFQLCDDTGSGDPVCITDMCVDGYKLVDGACVLDEGSTCDGRNDSVDISQSCIDAGKACVENSQGNARCADTCETLEATCAAENRDCDAALTLDDDAVCGACQPGYSDDGAGTCVVDTTANCSVFGADGIAMECSDRNQECVERMSGGAYCGDCLSGFEFNPSTNSCQEVALCGGDFCEDDEFCYYAQDGSAPVCSPKECLANQAKDLDNDICVACSETCNEEGYYPITIDGACVCASDVFCSFNTDGASQRCFVDPCKDDPSGSVLSPNGTSCEPCGITCGARAGERARQWPKSTIDGVCFCEVQEGYATPFGGSGAPVKCDEDQDGWINLSSDSIYQTALSKNDDAVLSNFRCERRMVDRIILQNEIGQRRAVSLCGDELIDYNPSTVPVCNDPDGLTELVLSEEDDIDSDDAILRDANAYPLYGSRAFAAKELNSLTKGCVSANGDLNANGLEDISEQQAIEKNRISGLTFSTDEKFVFQSMSYFLELHKSFYEPSTQPGNPGAYVIAERSRCDADFTMGYGSGGTYGQQCIRGRRQDYDYNTTSLNGFDFAYWGCDETIGSCEIPGPLVDASRDDLDGDDLPDHGVCDYSDTPSDDNWRGMTHHSQFQCVVLKTSPDALVPEQLALDQVYTPGEATPVPYEFNSCTADDCTAGMTGCEESTSLGVYQPDVTNVTCITRERADVNPEDVGWVAIRYVPEGVSSGLSNPYIRGCIDESYGTNGEDHFKDLCPGYTDNPDAVLAAGNPGDVGKLICSCNRFFGGSNCEYTCLARSYANAGSPNAVGTSFVHVGDRERNYSDEENAEYACSADDNFCSLHPPVPAENFPGGRRGYWMCGEMSLTHTVDANLADVPYLEASATIDGVSVDFQLEGKVNIMPVKRELLEETGCTTNCYSAF